MPRIGILETGRPKDTIRQRFGDYPQMLHRYFIDRPDLSFLSYHVSSGETLPNVTGCDGWIITGSAAGVYEDHPWLPPLRDFVTKAMDKAMPMLGICFGHQLMAQALGGTVVKSAKGRGLGIQHYDLTPAGQQLLPGLTGYNLVALHQDQVTVPPSNAAVLAQSPFCAYAALGYGNWGLSFQSHPEYTVEIAREITAGWQQENPVPADQYAKAVASFDGVTSDAALLAPRIGAFLAQRTA